MANEEKIIKLFPYGRKFDLNKLYKKIVCLSNEYNIYVEVDKYNNVYIPECSLVTSIHVEIYIKNDNNDIIILNHRAGSTSIISCALYKKNLISEKCYFDKNYLFWKNLDSRTTFFRKKNIHDFKNDAKICNNIYMVINSDIKTHILRKLNHLVRERRKKFNYIEYDKFLNICIEYLKYNNTDELKNLYSNFHYTSVYSKLNLLDISYDKIKFYDTSKTKEFCEMFFNIPFVKHNERKPSDINIEWNDLTAEQQNKLLDIYKNDIILFEDIKKNGNIVL